MTTSDELPDPARRPSLAPAIVLAFAWAVVAIVAEFTYASATDDIPDLLWVAVVWILIGITWGMTHAGWIAGPSWGSALRERIRTTIRSFTVQTGIDFGGTPEYERRLPTPLVRLTTAFYGVLVLAFLAKDVFPGRARSALLDTSALLYLTYAAVLWGWSIFLALSALAVVGIHTNDVILNRDRFAARRRQWQSGLVATLAVLPALATAFLPSWLPVAVVAAGAILGGVALGGTRHGQIRFLWRMRDSSSVYSMGSAWLMAWGDLSLAGVIVLTVIPSAGATWTGAGQGAPITASIGTFTAWAGALALWTWVVVGPVRLLRLARLDPARAVPTALEFEEAAPTGETREELEARGFRVRAEADPERRAVLLRLDEEAPRRRLDDHRTEDGRARWRLHPGDLLNPGVLAEVRAADRTMRREELVAAIRRLLTSARLRQFQSGTGFWIAPHLWYVPAMSRDTDEETSLTVGPPYHRIMSPEARQHAYEVFRAVHVDLVFIEDGVPVESVEHVLGQLFGHFDLWGVEPIEDRHVFPTPGIRVLIHTFEFDAPLDEDGYPEPDYENVGRGRVLHIMRDRGGDDVEDPIDSLPIERPRLVPAGVW